MPRKGGLYRKTGDGKAEPVKATRLPKRDKHNRIVNPDKGSVVAGREHLMRENDSAARRPDAMAGTDIGGAEKQGGTGSGKAAGKSGKDK